MSALMNADPDLAVLREDLAVLKRDVASLIEHMKCGAMNTVQNAADQIDRGVGASANKREWKASARPRHQTRLSYNPGSGEVIR